MDPARLTGRPIEVGADRAAASLLWTSCAPPPTRRLMRGRLMINAQRERAAGKPAQRGLEIYLWTAIIPWR